MAGRYGDVVRNKQDEQTKQLEDWKSKSGYQSPIDFRQRELERQFSQQERPGAPHFYDQIRRANTWDKGGSSDGTGPDFLSYVTGPELFSSEGSSGFAPDQRLYRQAMGDDGYRRPLNYPSIYNDTSYVRGLRDQRDRIQTGRPTPPQPQERWRPHRQPVQGVINNALQQIVADLFGSLAHKY